MTQHLSLTFLMVLAVVRSQGPSALDALLISVSPDVLRIEPRIRFRPETMMADYVLTSSTQGVLFDVDGDGTRERVAWPAQDSELAFLVLDRNANGRIDNGTELIGNSSVPGIQRAVGALRSLNMASNGGADKGAIDDDDPLYARLLLWCDRNRDGVSSPGELRTASDVATKIGLGYVKLGKADPHGNVFRYWSWLELRTAGGKGNAATSREDHVVRVRYMYEVALRVEPTRR